MKHPSIELDKSFQEWCARRKHEFTVSTLVLFKTMIYLSALVIFYSIQDILVDIFRFLLMIWTYREYSLILELQYQFTPVRIYFLVIASISYAFLYNRYGYLVIKEKEAIK
jgi:hypothetical protein